jgi:CheY-like chemotaxis protein
MVSAGATKRLKPRILIVEDDPGSRDALADLLRDEGYDVVTAADGGDGLSRLRGGARPRAIILDLMMAGMDGWDFRTEQKRDPQFGSVPVIAVSAAGKLVDADYTLRKPIDFDKLLQILNSLP